MSQSTKQAESNDSNTSSDALDKEVLDGEVVQNSKSSDDKNAVNGAETTFKRREKSETSQNNKAEEAAKRSNMNKKASNIPPTKPKTSKKVMAVLLILLLLNVLTLLYALQNRQLADELRNDLNQAQTQQTDILNTQDELAPKLQRLAALPEELVSQAQLDESLNELRSLLAASAEGQNFEALEARQNEFETAIKTELTKALDNQAVKADGTVDLTPINQEIAVIQSRLTELQEGGKTGEKSERNQVILTQGKVHQWILALNTDWMLGKPASQTLQKLAALEKAIASSDLSNSTVLARLIGEDMAYLKQWREQNGQVFPSMEPLRAAVLKLQPPKINVEHSEKPVEAENLSSGEVQEQESAWQRLLNRLSALVTVRNREHTGESTTVEALLKHDIQQQRLLLLIDRVEWSAKHESAQQYQSSITAVETFVKQNFAMESEQFTQLLQPFKTFKLNSRHELAISEFHVKL